MAEHAKNTQSRKWLLTINNPQSCDLNHGRIVEILHLFHPTYFCMADEIATTGTYHTHIYLYSKSPIRFGTVKNRFPTAHIDKATGTAVENRDYIRKEGKWADTAKVETRVKGTFLEFGTPPSPAEENSPKMHQLLQNVKDGFSTSEIVEENPAFCLQTQKIDQLRDNIESEPFRNQFRELQVHYLFGASGAGKTRSSWSKTRMYRDTGRNAFCAGGNHNHTHVAGYDSSGQAYWDIYSDDGTFTGWGRLYYYWEETRTIPAVYETQYRYRDLISV